MIRLKMININYRTFTSLAQLLYLFANFEDIKTGLTRYLVRLAERRCSANFVMAEQLGIHAHVSLIRTLFIL